MLTKAARVAAWMLLAPMLGVGCRRAVTPQPPPAPQVPSGHAKADVETEVVALHAAFVRWFRGEVPRDAQGLGDVQRALAPAFEIVMPSGAVADRDATLAGIEGAYGRWSPADDIEIRNVVLRHVTAELVLASYEEWQVRSGETRGRLSTVAFLVDPGSPRGLQWLRVHETWLPAAAQD